MARSLDDLDWPRRTERLELRRLTLADAPAVFAYRRLPEVGQWMTSLPTDLTAFADAFESLIAHNVAVVRGDRVIGDGMIKVGDGWAQQEVADRAVGTVAELGWCLAPEVQGRGYGEELVRELLAIAFRGLGLRRVEAGCFAENVPSWRLMEKFGMRRESHAVKESLHRDGTWRDGFLYALLAEEWLTAEGHPPR